MKFTLVALMVAGCNAVKMRDDCDGKWCNKGLPYDWDEKPLRAAEADYTAKTYAFNGANEANKVAQDITESCFATEEAVKKLDTKADIAKAEAAANFAATSYLDKQKFADAEAKYKEAVKNKETVLLARYTAIDNSTRMEFASRHKKYNLDDATADLSAP